MKKIVSIFTVVILNLIALTNISAEEYEEYKSGDLVRYNNMAFYVLFDSDASEEDVQLLKAFPLNEKELNKYTDNKASMFNEGGNIIYYPASYNNSNYPPYQTRMAKGQDPQMNYYYSDNCYTGTFGYVNNEGCKNDYDSSNVKEVVDLWTSEKFDENDLITDSLGYKTRLITLDELLNFNFEFNGSYYEKKENTPYWIYDPYFPNYDNYWTMTPYDNDKVYYIGSHIYRGYVYYENAVRPVVNLKKKSLDKNTVDNHEYHSVKKGEYQIGDVVNYNETKFYVIKNSSSSDNEVTLLKDQPLTVYEVNKCLNMNSESEISGNNSSYAKISYGGTYYNSSTVKKIVDTWVYDNISSSDIVKSEPWFSSIRLINMDDLYDLGYEGVYYSTIYNGHLVATDNTPSFMLNEKSDYMFTSILYDSSDVRKMIGYKEGDFYHFRSVNSDDDIKGTVRPVVTLNKKEIAPKITNVEEIEDTVSGDIENNNIEVDVETEVDNSKVTDDIKTDLNNSLSVVVPNTLSSKNIVFIIVGIVIVIISSFTFTYFKKK